MWYELKNVSSLSATTENPQAEKGNGGKLNNGRKGAPCIEPLKDGETYTLLNTRGPGVIRKIWCTIPPDQIQHMRNVIIRIYWDGQQHPSVEVPLGDFFGVAHGRQRHLITECVGMQEGRGFNCWIPMPFKEEARITVENDSGSDIPLFFYQIDFTVGDELDNIGYFHAQFRRSNPPLKEDYVILDGVQGRGVYLGTVIGIRNLYPYLEEWWGEGEVKFYLDGDREYPTICGTGTEDYIGSAWGTGEVCTPYQGAPLIDDEKGLYSLYRFHVKDPIYFQSDLKVTIQQIGAGSREKAVSAYGSLASTYRAVGTEQGSDLCLFERSDDYCSVAYWYQTLPTVPFPQLPDRRQRTEGLLE